MKRPLAWKSLSITLAIASIDKTQHEDDVMMNLTATIHFAAYRHKQPRVSSEIDEITLLAKSRPKGGILS